MEAQSSVDILIATYNGESFLKEQIDSLLDQTHPHIHLIFRDDCSTDGTRNILEEYKKKYPEKIEVIYGEKNLGPAQSFSALMEASRAEYVCFCDQDDVWKKDKVEKTLGLLKKEGNERPLLVHTDLCVVDEKLNKIHSSHFKFCKLFPKKGSSLSLMLAQNVVTGCTVMMNRALVNLASPLPKETVMHDYWVSLVAAAFGKIIVLDEATLFYRQHSKNQLGATKFLSLKNIKRAYDKICNSSKRKRPQMDAFFNRYSNKLSIENQQLMRDYLALPQMNYPKSRYVIMKRGFWKQGWLANVVSFLLQKQP